MDDDEGDEGQVDFVSSVLFPRPLLTQTPLSLNPCESQNSLDLICLRCPLDLPLTCLQLS